MHPHKISVKLALSIAASLICLAGTALLAETARGAMSEGADFEFGGHGDGAGKFYDTRDIKFDQSDVMYILDGGEFKGGQKVGNFLVQRFDRTGKFLGQFSVYDDAYGERNDPERMALDTKGDVYISQPKAEEIWEFAPSGKKVRTLKAPGVIAITDWKVAGVDRIAAIAYRSDKTAPYGRAFDQLLWSPADSDTVSSITLSVSAGRVNYMTADGSGNLYVAGGAYQILKFDPAGKLIGSVGAGTTTGARDGSELPWDVALDKNGNVYTWSWGNPGSLVKLDPAFKTETMHEGQFSWSDAWSNGSYVPVAFDSDNRAWIAVTGYVPPNAANFAKYHYRPAILRLKPDFLDPAGHDVLQRSTFSIGVKPAVTTTAAYDTTYDLSPVPMEFVMLPANRQVDAVHVEFNVYDAYHVQAASGSFDLTLQNGVEARHPVQFIPTKYGWYTAEFRVLTGSTLLATAGHHFGVTPLYSSLPALERGSSAGGWVDPIRQAFAGLPLLRLHPKNGDEQSLTTIDKALTDSQKYGVTTFLQFTSKADCDPEFVRKTVARFKGRLKVYEIMNEPNFGMGPDAYVALAKEVAPIIRSEDPDAKVMGPDVCGIQLGWYAGFFKAGGGSLFDIISLHDYEGNESIDPTHWNYKFAELHKLMASASVDSKPIWQTERDITALRGQDFLPIMQAVRITLHQDLLESLGVPNEHDYAYYLNEGGYSAVPSYLWSNDGPFPAAFATRTRQAMVGGKQYSGRLDFGANGNDLFFGLRFSGSQGQTVILRNLGTLDRALNFGIKGGGSVEIVDAFGNKSSSPIKNGTVSITVSQMPLYVLLKPQQAITAPVLNFGADLARDASFAYSAGPTDHTKPLNLAALNDGTMQSLHPDDPNGIPFMAEIPTSPQNLDLTFKEPKRVNRVLLFSTRADNIWCALLDFDVQAWKNNAWTTVAQIRTPLPASEPDHLGASDYIGWIQDDNIGIAQFTPVVTDRLRIVVRRTTSGFQPDSGAADAGKLMTQRLMLREVEVFGPDSTIAASNDPVHARKK